MGGVLCCITQPITDENVHQKSAPEAVDYKCKKWMTLEECLLSSPSISAPHHSSVLGGGGHDQVQMCRKNLPKRIHPSSSPDDDINIEEFFTPRRSFSLERIDEREEDEEEEEEEMSASVTPSSRIASGKSRRKVSFRLPGEADIYIYYTPKDTLDEEP